MNLADKYQVPAFLLGDQLLGDTIATVDDLKPRASKCKSYRASDAQVKRDGYRRYKLTKNGVSPRAYYGQNGVIFIVDSHVHDEAGHITEDADLARKMVEKRLAKSVGMGKETFGLPARYGDPSGELLVICFGSTYGAVREGVDAARGADKRVAMLHFNRVWPFPVAEAKRVAGRFEKIVAVENNALGQFDRLFRRETGLKTSSPILRYDGRPFLAADLGAAFKRRS
jgi:2-oxoglutarate ferredoxin oxidoreductase subunit alpha